MPRLFTGIEIPDAVRLSLARLGRPLPGAKWVAAQDFHITLRFAGDIDKRTAAEFTDFLAEVDVPAFEIRLSGLGAFGGNDPRVIWAGIEPQPGLDALARAHERAARAVGLPPETRTFRPHVTLARLRNSRVEAVARFLEHHGAFRSERFLVRRFVLFSSRPQSGGGPYVVEQVFPCSGVFDDADENEL